MFKCVLLGQTYETAAQVASVYSLGKMESAAAVALLHKVPKPIKEAVTIMVRPGVYEGCPTYFGKSILGLVIWLVARQYGMPRFITHEAIANGLLSDKYCSATGTLGNWKMELTNSEALLQLLVNRMETDWLATPPKQRRPWHVKELDTLF